MTRLENPSICTCGHRIDIHYEHKCGYWCDCNKRKFVPDPKEKVIINVTLSGDIAYKLKNHVMLRHGTRKGGLSLEIEYAIRKYLGEDVEEPELYNEWKENNR